MKLATLPDQRAKHDPLGPSIADDNVNLNNTEFLDAVVGAAAALQARGVSAGDVVAIMLPNTASFVVSLFAARRPRRSTRVLPRPRLPTRSRTPQPRC